MSTLERAIAIAAEQRPIDLLVERRSELLRARNEALLAIKEANRELSELDIACRVIERLTQRRTEDDAYGAFLLLRWPDTNGEPQCPRCDSVKCYSFKARRIFKCRECKHQFTATSGTIFANRKLSYRDYMDAAEVVTKRDGQSTLQISRDLGVQYKTAVDLVRKLSTHPLDAHLPMPCPDEPYPLSCGLR